jgi:hypothetical protein
MKVLQPTPSVSSDVISLQDENLAITMGPHIEDGFDSSTPFYISLNVMIRSFTTFLWTQEPLTMSCPKFLWKK